MLAEMEELVAMEWPPMEEEAPPKKVTDRRQANATRAGSARRR